MSAPVDVLDVLDPASHLGVKQSAKNGNAGFVDMRDWGAYLGRTKDARAAVAELIEADAAFDAAASEVATYEAKTPYPSRNYRTVCYVQYRDAMARRAAALARVRGAA